MPGMYRMYISVGCHCSFLGCDEEFKGDISHLKTDDLRIDQIDHS